MPHAARKKAFKFLSESPIVAKVAYVLKISFIFVGILFVDALQRMYRIHVESDVSLTEQSSGDVRVAAGLAARRFYAERNTYLTGFTLFLSLVLTSTFSIISELIETQEQYTKIKKDSSSGGNLGSVDNDEKEVAELKRKLAEEEMRTKDYEILKQQAAQQATEFDTLAVKYNEATGNISDKRFD
ncbi:hypothetical protein H0H92_004746 [Tricholoma furcatifolium]|nr:hypothetical protein H0H92_004746 [Tricholoma furcatifolium]